MISKRSESIFYTSRPITPDLIGWYVFSLNLYFCLYVRGICLEVSDGIDIYIHKYIYILRLCCVDMCDWELYLLYGAHFFSYLCGGESMCFGLYVWCLCMYIALCFVCVCCVRYITFVGR